MSRATARFWAVIICLLFLSFGGYYLYRYFSDDYRTENAYEFTVVPSYFAKGLIIRTETPINNRYNGYISYTVDEGAKMKVGTEIAKIYHTQEDANEAEKAEDIRTELSELKKIVRSADAYKTIEISRLSEDISLSVIDLARVCANEDYSSVAQKRIEIQHYLGIKQMLSGDSSLIEQRIAQLEAHSHAPSEVISVTADSSGYFSRYSDGYESRFTTEDISSFDYNTLTGIIAGSYPYNGDALGKTVTELNWYMAVPLSLDDAEAFYEGRRVTVNFTGEGNAKVEAEVISVKKEERGAVILLWGDNVVPEILSLRNPSVRIDFAPCSGVRFPASALRIVDGYRGVYVENGYDITFKKVNIVYSGKDYYLSKLEYYSSEYLNIFDTVIVEGKDLYDGKPIV